ncbi:hypothetical protein DFH07DRAFT_787401 [Mycena maculata]|uniref:Uncharacterized protein n=1 Tax=Mycena maculata TaxID=230809 RepID=A0AAD7KHR1_9AGAR|nr:hypothetical protein DFH07DRAFT_787401 [Mycena maculata]
MMDPHGELTKEEYEPIAQEIDGYLLQIRLNETNRRLRAESIQILQNFLDDLHHTEYRFKKWVYGFMDRKIAELTREKLDEIWAAYKAESNALKAAAQVNPPTSSFEIPRPPPNLNKALLNYNNGQYHSAPYDTGYAAESSRGRSRRRSLVSIDSGVFKFQPDSSGHNSAAASVHSRQYNMPTSPYPAQNYGNPPAAPGPANSWAFQNGVMHPGGGQPIPTGPQSLPPYPYAQPDQQPQYQMYPNTHPGYGSYGYAPGYGSQPGPGYGPGHGPGYGPGPGSF